MGERKRSTGAPQQRVPPPQKIAGRVIWPHKNLLDAVQPTGNRQGMPVGGGYVWKGRPDDQARDAAVAAFLAWHRARLCPGPECRRLADKLCPGVCARPLSELGPEPPRP